jgi:N-acetylglucosamine-6-phosphate deacetylase
VSGLVITNARVVCPDVLHDVGWLATSDGVIDALGAGTAPPDVMRAREVIDAEGRFLLPGFIDVHTHGAVGHEAMDGDADGIRAMARFYVTRGVTAFLATTWTAGTAPTLTALRAIGEAMRAPTDGAQVLGAHMEGPYLSPRWPGAHDRAAIRRADLAEARSFLDTGVVRRITLAPEVGDNLALVEECVRRGIAVSAGHTDATYDQMVAAVARGLRHVTHVYNAMRPLHHRDPGVVGAAFTISDLLAELIADDVHVHPVAARALVLAKGASGIALVTDSLRPTGLAPGIYEAGGKRVRAEGGAVRLEDGTLAGSVLTMDAGLRNLLRATALPLAELWRTASWNGAVAAGVASRKGALVAGMDADLVVVDDAVNVRMTVVEGQVRHRA